MNESQRSAGGNEAAIARLLTDLPLRSAPAALEARVMRVLEQRAARPWWQRGFGQWPATARVGFVLACCGLIGITLWGGVWTGIAGRATSTVAGMPPPWTHWVVSVAGSAFGAAALLVRVIPPIWLYGTIAFCGLLYAALFGLGAAAYRTLYRQPTIAGQNQ